MSQFSELKCVAFTFIIKKILKQIFLMLLPLIILNELGYVSMTNKTRKLFNDQIEKLKGKIVSELQGAAEGKKDEVKKTLNKKLNAGLNESRKILQEGETYMNKKLNEKEKF